MKNIAIAGNIIVDNIKMINTYPSKQSLAVIEEFSSSLGGQVNNLSIDLARLDSNLEIFAKGVIGEDANGEQILKILGEYKNINTSQIVRKGITSFCDVMTDSTTKQRTFFTYAGADSSLDVKDFDFNELKALNVSHLHVGYILLLEMLDSYDEEYGTRLARVLHEAQKNNITTSVDVVSLANGNYKKLVPPSLKYSDYCIINETEAQQVTGIALRDENDKLIVQNTTKVLMTLKEMGVKKWVVIHSPEASFGVDENDNVLFKNSLQLPKGYIKGSVGAGDAFCAGALYIALKGGDLDQALDSATATAASSLSEAGSYSGVKSYEEVIKLIDMYPRQTL